MFYLRLRANLLPPSVLVQDGPKPSRDFLLLFLTLFEPRLVWLVQQELASGIHPNSLPCDSTARITAASAIALASMSLPSLCLNLMLLIASFPVLVTLSLRSSI